MSSKTVCYSGVSRAKSAGRIFLSTGLAIMRGYRLILRGALTDDGRLHARRRSSSVDSVRTTLGTTPRLGT